MIPTTFFFSSYGDHRDLHSFPTRRSSDLPRLTGVRIELAQLYVNMGRYAEARQQLRSVLNEKAPTDRPRWTDRKSTRLNSSHVEISYAVFCLKKKNLRQYMSSYLPLIPEN